YRRSVPDRVGGDLVDRDQEIARQLAVHSASATHPATARRTCRRSSRLNLTAYGAGASGMPPCSDVLPPRRLPARPPRNSAGHLQRLAAMAQVCRSGSRTTMISDESQYTSG